MDRRRFIATTLAAAAAGAAVTTTSAGAAPLPGRGRPLFLGTYTSEPGGGTGIGLATYDETTGRITGAGTLAGVLDPSYLAAHPSGQTLYCVNERSPGTVTAVALSPDGAHRVLGTRGTGGDGPCHLSVHPSGRWLLSANYTSGSVAVHPIEESGALGERTDLVKHSEPAPGPGQQGPRAHQIVTSPDGRHVLAVDLGTDTVYTYRLDTGAGTLRPVTRVTLRAGAGPRHLAFHPSGCFAYVANELDNTVVACAYDATTGRLTPGEPQSTGTPPGLTNYPAQPLVTRDGRFAYVANRGHNSLARYAVERDGAQLRLLGTTPAGGDFPRHLAFSPAQRLLFVSNQRSGSVSVFRVDEGTGELTLTGEPFAAPMAVCALPL